MSDNESLKYQIELAEKEAETYEKKREIFEDERAMLRAKDARKQEIIDSRRNVEIQLRQVYDASTAKLEKASRQIRDESSLEFNFNSGGWVKKDNGKPTFSWKWKTHFKDVRLWIYRESGTYSIARTGLEITERAERTEAICIRNTDARISSQTEPLIDTGALPGETYNYYALLGVPMEVEEPILIDNEEKHRMTTRPILRMVTAFLKTYRTTIPSYYHHLDEADFERELAKKRQAATDAGSTAYTGTQEEYLIMPDLSDTEETPESYIQDNLHNWKVMLRTNNATIQDILVMIRQDVVKKFGEKHVQYVAQLALKPLLKYKKNGI